MRSSRRHRRAPLRSDSEIRYTGCGCFGDGTCDGSRVHLSRGAAAHAATRRLQSCTRTVHGRARIELRRPSSRVDSCSSRRCTQDPSSHFGRKRHGRERQVTIPGRPQTCAFWRPTSFLGARGSAVTAESTAELRGCMGTCVAQTLAVRLPQLMLCGA
eukprot:4093720-Prymnesium_polylepis.1